MTVLVPVAGAMLPEMAERWQVSCLITRMNPTEDAAMLTEISSTEPQNSPSVNVNGGGLEQQMSELGLSSDTCRFLRKFHVAEKEINDAFDAAHQGGHLDDRVSQVYHAMYRSP